MDIMVTINLISQNSCERFTVVFLLPNMSCLSSAWSARTCSSCNFGDLFPILIWDFFLTAHLSIVASWLRIAVKQGNIIAGSLFLLSIYCNIIAECLAFCEDLGAVPLSLSLDSVVTFNSNLSTTHYLQSTLSQIQQGLNYECTPHPSPPPITGVSYCPYAGQIIPPLDLKK